MLFPAGFLVVTRFYLNFIGDGLREMPSTQKITKERNYGYH